jgi:MFS family permease
MSHAQYRVLGGGRAVRMGKRTRYRRVFGNAEFRALWSAQILSVTGDQLVKVALTVLVYDRTGSAAFAALTFAASFVPSFAGGVLLAGLADRLPRRTVMLACDLVRMILAATMALPGVPLAVLVGLLFAVTMIGAPFTAARAATYPEILADADTYQAGTAITLTTYQLAQVLGFSGGGLLAALAGARVCLIADAATFAASALLIRFGVTKRADAAARAPRVAETLTGLAAAARLVFADPALRTPMLLGWLACCYNAWEAIAAPWAREMGGGAIAAGLLLAAQPAGYSVSALAFGLLGPAERAKLARVLPAACCAVLLPVALRPSLPVALVIMTASGACACYQVAANASFVAAAPERQRSQAFGLAAAGMSLGQGIAMILAGVAAQHLAPAVVIGGAGALGVAAAVWLTAPWPVRQPARPPRPGTGD